MMVKEYITSLHNHTRIDFVTLKETPKAVLMKIKHVESNHVKDLLNYYGVRKKKEFHFKKIIVTVLFFL